MNYERVLDLPRLLAQKSFFLLGPRSTGKSHLIRAQLTGQAQVIDLLKSDNFLRLSERPGELEEMIHAGAKGLVVIDEVQRLPILLDEVHRLIEETPTRFLLTGSSARRLRQGRANLLAGRARQANLFPLVSAEIPDFDLARYLTFGGLPQVYGSAEPHEELDAYVGTYLREEIQAEALVRDIGGYARLLDLIATASGRILNLSALAQDAGIGHQTARRYLEIMEDTLLLWRIPAWSGSDRASLLGHPKILLFDLGVRNALLRRPLDRPLPDEQGLLLEHFVGLELLRRTRDAWPEAKLYHFRTRSGVEVDYVVEVNRELWGIEVKASEDVRSENLKGLRVLGDRAAGLKRKIVVFLGPRRMRQDDVEIIPLLEFLAELPS